MRNRQEGSKRLIWVKRRHRRVCKERHVVNLISEVGYTERRKKGVWLRRWQRVADEAEEERWEGNEMR